MTAEAEAEWRTARPCFVCRRPVNTLLDPSSLWIICGLCYCMHCRTLSYPDHTDNYEMEPDE